MRNCSQKVSIAMAMIAVAGSASAHRHGQAKFKTVLKVVSSTVKPTVRYEFSRSVGRGRLVKGFPGREGVITRTYRVKMDGEKVVSKELVKEESTASEPTVFLMGRPGYAVASRGSFSRHRVLDMSASAYDPSPRSNGGSHFTKMGHRTAYGQVAVDPRVIPLGSLVFVEGYGFALASDTGSAIKGNRIDLCFEDRHSASDFGRRTVRVHVLR